MIKKRNFTIDDILKLTSINEVKISSSGNIAISYTKSDLEKNKNNNYIHIIKNNNKEIFLTSGSDSSPRWSPNGETLAFLSKRGENENSKGQGIYIYNLEGEPKNIYWFKNGVLTLEWYDNENLIAIVPENDKYYDNDGDYISTDRLPFWMDDTGFIGTYIYTLYFINISSGYVKELKKEENYIYPTSLCSCNKNIFYSTPIDIRFPYKHKLVKINPESSEESTLLQGYFIESLACINNNLYGLIHNNEIGISSHFKLYRIDENKADCLTCNKIDKNIQSIIGQYSNGIALQIYDRGFSKIILFNDNFKEIVSNGFVLAGSSNKDTLVYVYAEPTKAMEVYKLDNKGVLKLTSYNDFLNDVNLYEHKHEEVNVNGKKIDGWIIMPEGNDKKPLILYIHGGPKGMYGYNFYPEMQLFASNGYAIVFANPTGSDGYDEKFADIRGKYGEEDFNELMNFLDYIIKKYNIDKDRMAVTGISYGGYMTNVFITKTNLFKAAVSENGIADWISDYYASDIGYFFDPDQIGKTPHENLNEYIKKSPFYHINNVTTPVLLIHSNQDYRCFVDQSLAMHISLYMNNKESRIVLFTKGSHGHSTKAEPRHRKKRYEIKLSFINEKLKK
ncbi:prolyl oligopeptidase family serine peptidase [Caldisphaera sp.]|uniref:alpha/beta hydrolase family protein n=1 Tax=Caldisphaera sp. TaxID=2060322 RepID=UPI003D0D5725